MIKKIIYYIFLIFLNNILKFLLVYWFIKYSIYDSISNIFITFIDFIFALKLQYFILEICLFLILYFLYYLVYNTLVPKIIKNNKFLRLLNFIFYNLFIFKYNILNIYLFYYNLCLLKPQDFYYIWITIIYYYLVYRFIRFYLNYCLLSFDFFVIYFYFLIFILLYVYINNSFLYNYFIKTFINDLLNFYFKGFGIIYFFLKNFLFYFLFIIWLTIDFKHSDGTDNILYYKLYITTIYLFCLKLTKLLKLVYLTKILYLLLIYFLYLVLIYNIVQYCIYLKKNFYFIFELDLFFFIYMLITLNYTLMFPKSLLFFLNTLWFYDVNTFITFFIKYYDYLKILSIIIKLLLNIHLILINYIFINGFLKYIYLQRSLFFYIIIILKFIVQFLLSVFSDYKIVYYIILFYKYYKLFNRFVYENKLYIYISTIIFIKINFFNLFKGNILNLPLYYLFFN